MNTNAIPSKSIELGKKYTTILNGLNLFPFVLVEALDEDFKTKMVHAIGHSKMGSVSGLFAFIAASHRFGAKHIRLTSNSMLLNDDEDTSFKASKNRFAGMTDPAMMIYSLDLETKVVESVASPYRLHGELGSIEWLNNEIEGADDITGRKRQLESVFDDEVYREITRFINEFIEMASPESLDSVMTPSTLMSIVMANENSNDRKSSIVYGPAPDEEIIGGFAFPERMVHEEIDGFSMYHYAYGNVLEGIKPITRRVILQMLKG